MKRFKTTLSYDGTNYYGFQRQKNNLITIQEEIEKVLFKIFKEPITIVSSGRTDKGVHAINQVFHFDVITNMQPENLKKALNTYLPKTMIVNKVELKDDSFHARFSSIKKEYSYYLNTNKYNPFLKDYIFQLNRKLDLEKIIDASKLFIGKHNFYNFCTNEEGSVKDYFREIVKIQITDNNGIIQFKVVGDGFLRNMVRMIVAVLIEIGLNKKDKQFIIDRLDKKSNRSNYKVPGCGLYLDNVHYETI